jgi:uncharacterized cupin superfamily protein
VKIVHESEVPERHVPGRSLRWIADGASMQPRYLSSCVMRVLPGETVRHAHSHPQGEELIYVIAGSGKVAVDGEVRPLEPGTEVLFTQGCVHQVRNSGTEELKVICFFAPPADLGTYVFHEDVAFPETDAREARP